MGPLPRHHTKTELQDITPAPRALPWTWLIVLGGLAAFHLVFLVWRVGMPLEVDRNESWNAWHATHALIPSRLYPKSTDLIINNYPPLSFIFIKLISFGNDLILVGRIVSLVSVGVIAAGVADIAEKFGASRGVAAIAGLWCFAVFAILVPKYMGMNDPNFLALAVMVIGLALFVRDHQREEVSYLGCAIMAIALFFKHSIVVLPIVALVWQYSTRRRLFWRSLLCFGGVGLVGLSICRVVYGIEFLEQLLLPRQVRLSSGFRFFRVVLPLLPAVMVWGRWIRSSAPSESITFTKLAFAIALPLNFMQQCGAGVDYNATFEFIIVVSLALGCSLGRTRLNINANEKPNGSEIQRTLAALVILLALCGNRWEPYRFIGSEAYRSAVHRQVDVLASEVARVRTLPGRISCDIFVVCYRAGKAFEFDGFGMHQRVATGVWSAERLEHEKLSRGLRFETVSEVVVWQSTSFLNSLTATSKHLR